MTTITDADEAAALAWKESQIAEIQVLMSHTPHKLIQAFARHRQAAREKVVGEIVAWLRDGFMRDFDQLWRDQLINEIEAKFGGRDGNE